MASATPSLFRSFRAACHASSWRVASVARFYPPAALRARLPARMLSSASASPSQQPIPDDNFYDDYVAAIDPQRIKLAAKLAETPLSIAQCLKLGQSLSTKALLKNMAFLNRELPVRFSKRIVELNDLPKELRETGPLMNLINNYSASFQELQTYSDNSRLM